MSSEAAQFPLQGDAVVSIRACTTGVQWATGTTPTGRPPTSAFHIDDLPRRLEYSALSGKRPDRHSVSCFVSPPRAPSGSAVRLERACTVRLHGDSMGAA